MRVFLITLVFLWGCTSTKKIQLKSTDRQAMIDLAIDDFLKKPRLIEKNAVFSLSFSTVRSKSGSVISIGPNPLNVLVTKETVAGSFGKMQSRYVERKGKLFIWWDDSVALTDSALATYKRFDLLQDDINGAIKIPDIFSINHSSSAHYYYCTTDPKYLLRVVTKEIPSAVIPARLKCQSAR